MIIGLTGNAYSGKDTCAAMLAEIVRPKNRLKVPVPVKDNDTVEGYFVETLVASLAFADPMKQFCKEVFDFSDEQLYGKLKETPDLRYPRTHVESTGAYRTHLTPRHALQTLGTDWGRSCYQNIWVEYGIRRALKFLDGGAKLVTITDVRFENEAEAIREVDGKILRVTRPGKTGAVGITGHVSETQMHGIAADFEIVNDSTLEALRERVRAAWQFFKGAPK